MENLIEKYEDILTSDKYDKIDEFEQVKLALMLDNVEKEITAIQERSDAGDISQFTPILMPVVRRVMPALIANNIAGVQPLKAPTGYIYGMNYRYTNDSINPISPTTKAQILVVDAADAVGDTLTGSSSGATGVVRYVEGTSELVELTGTTEFIPGEAVTGGTSTTVQATYSNIAQFQKILKNYTGPYSTAAGEALGNDMKEVGLSIERKSVEAVTRKLKATMTMEMLQDMKAMYGMNAMNELISILSAELKLEIDREILKFANDTYTVKPDYVIMATNTPTAARWEIEYYRLLAVKLSSEARGIGKDIKLGTGNTVVATPRVITALSQLNAFNDAKLSGVNISNSNFQGQVGTFEGKKVLADNFADNDYITVSYVGPDARQSGIIYSPYVPLSLIKTVNQESGQPNVIGITRYAVASNPISPEKFGRTFQVKFDNSFAL